MSEKKEVLESLPESSAPPEVLEDSHGPIAGPVIEARPPTVIEDDPDPDQQDPEEEARQEAFDDVPLWNNQPLKAWSFTRESVFHSLRRSMGAPPISEVNSDLNAWIADAARILWLCSHDELEISVLRPQPAVMQAAIDRWAEEALPPQKRQEAVDLTVSIFNRATLNRPIAVNDGTPAGN
jgi:hypothetical protein